MLQYIYRGDAPPTRRSASDVDQPWSDYAPIAGRPQLRWPNGAKVALWFSPNVLHYEYAPPQDPWLNMWSRMPQPDVLAYGRQDYGSRVGFWRMLEILDKHGARCTACLNVEALEKYPSIRDALVERKWRYLGHGINNSRFIYGHSEAEERAYYDEMRDRIQNLTGMRMLGLGGPGPQAATESTPDVLADLGFLYHSDWFHDDQPMPLRVKKGRLISLPYAIVVNDAPYFGVAFEADLFADMAKRQLDALLADDGAQGRVFCISLHPALIGQPQRARYLDDLVGYVLKQPGVWHTTADEIAEYYMTNYYDTMLAWLDQRRAAAGAKK